MKQSATYPAGYAARLFKLHRVYMDPWTVVDLKWIVTNCDTVECSQIAMYYIFLDAFRMDQNAAFSRALCEIAWFECSRKDSKSKTKLCMYVSPVHWSIIIPKVVISYWVSGCFCTEVVTSEAWAPADFDKMQLFLKRRQAQGLV